jgi:general L-amino acid transport system substrate-binding protein
VGASGCVARPLFAQSAGWLPSQAAQGKDRMSIIRTIFSTCMAASLAAGLAATVAGSAAAAEPTLAAVKKRGELSCGINGHLPGFSAMNEKKEYAGLEVDVCRAIAAATLGDAAKVKFVELNTKDRFDALRSGRIDMLARNSAATLERTTRTGVRDAAIIYVDGQAVVVPKKLGITALSQFANGTICILDGAVYERNIREWFAAQKLAYTPLMFDTQKAAYDAFYDGKCNAVTQDISGLTTTIVASGKAADYLVLPEIIARSPLAAYVRSGDEGWLDVVRWTVNALIYAEELGITQANVDSLLKTGSPGVKRLLGAPADDGKLLGLQGDWAYNAIRQVGNYGEIYDRNLGQGSPWKFPRGINALWNNGGILHALPLR